MTVGYLACGGWIASAVGVAARLGVADLLAHRPLTPEELASRTGSDALALREVLRLLAQVHVFEEGADGRFSNSAESEVLRSDHPRSLRAFCQLAAGDYQRVFQALGDTVATGRSATGVVFGSDLYTHLSAHAEEGRIYDGAMDDLARPTGAMLARRDEFRHARTVADVGGGRGALVAAIVRANRSMSGVCVDRADVTRRAEEEWRRREPELLGRLAFEAGDFFARVPPGHDIYLLKNVLHNWNDESAGRLLRTIRHAMRDRARLLVIESLTDGAMPPLYRALDELLQVVLCETGTTPRSGAAMRGLIEDQGLTVESVENLASGHTLFSVAPR